MEEIKDQTDLPNLEPEPPSAVTGNLGRNVALGLGVLFILILIGLAGYGLITHPLLTAVLRDIFIIVLALVTIVIGLFLAILIFQIQSLMALLRDEIKPILESTNQTVSTVRGTTTFVSDAVVNPMITASSYVSGVRQTLKVLAGGQRRRGKNEAVRREGHKE